MGVFLYSEKIAQTLLEGEKKRQYIYLHCIAAAATVIHWIWQYCDGL